MKIKKGDQVVVITGEDASSTPHQVLEVLKGGQKMVVQGVNQVYKHVKRGHPKSPSGGRLQMEMPIQSSNVMYYCESCSKPSRLGLRYTEEGSKERYCKKCNSSCGTISPPREKYATSK
ncbi:50S ribosomal protein L24 [Rubinisphaera sp.]|uniref:50S ribosomal protein L24 n=1 Tax=Rubinisphaera sp. TaxID=2024857 RepID=UPI000C0EB3EF|nr:50S ribosomal protein L24 [Rubinisphaera sp.]MBV11727.1 50S ribosomal protein L24 [Rubinisphaera sp.]HCS54588.1 50S ribosomal protein L24 [Planctomycetaceae bacterium]|tara:strand:+ start:96 stop:452 length:357 start_codon:yes stop_codon:yes gene_type:complete